MSAPTPGRALHVALCKQPLMSANSQSIPLELHWMDFKKTQTTNKKNPKTS